MERYLFPTIGLFFGFLVYQGCTKTLPHAPNDGKAPLYELRGLHAAVACAGCHGSGTPKSLSRLCIDCHLDVRPGPPHDQTQECGACHNEEEPPWLNGVTVPTTGETGDTGIPTPTGDTGPIEPADPIHDNLPLTKLCSDAGCHDDDRPADGLYYHTANAVNPLVDWDCGPCHVTGLPGSGWLVENNLHPVRGPHGTYVQNAPADPARWVVACDMCHLDLDNFQQFECSSCHQQLGALPGVVNIFPHFAIDYPDAGPEADTQCLCCHEYGDLDSPNPNPCL